MVISVEKWQQIYMQSVTRSVCLLQMSKPLGVHFVFWSISIHILYTKVVRHGTRQRGRWRTQLVRRGQPVLGFTWWGREVRMKNQKAQSAEKHCRVSETKGILIWRIFFFKLCYRSSYEMAFGSARPVVMVPGPGPRCQGGPTRAIEALTVQCRVHACS